MLVMCASCRMLTAVLLQLSQVQSFTIESVLSGIMYMRVQHYTEQLALIAVLDLLLKQQPQVHCVCLRRHKETGTCS